MGQIDNLVIYNYTIPERSITFDASGNIGIGVDAPDKKLIVNGDISLYSNTKTLFVNNIRSISGPINNFIAGNAFRIFGEEDELQFSFSGGTLWVKNKIVVNPNSKWSDFVFEDDYSLMPLHQLDKFIEENKHLPEIPSAKEVEANGISLGEMDAKLLQKIEELTLYTIEQQKKIDELEKEVKKLNKRRSR